MRSNTFLPSCPRRPGPARGADPDGSAPVDEKPSDVVAAKVAVGERLVVLPQPLPDLGDRGTGKKQRTVAGNPR